MSLARNQRQGAFYLLGSIHRLRDTDYPLPSVIEQAMNQSQQFYFEFDPNRGDDMARKLEAAAKLPRGVEIKDRSMQKPGITWDRCPRRQSDWVHLKAWGIALYLLDYPVHVHLSGAYGIDNYVEKKARARNCSIRGLESVDAHVGVFGGRTTSRAKLICCKRSFTRTARRVCSRHAFGVEKRQHRTAGIARFAGGAGSSGIESAIYDVAKRALGPSD